MSQDFTRRDRILIVAALAVAAVAAASMVLPSLGFELTFPEIALPSFNLSLPFNINLNLNSPESPTGQTSETSREPTQLTLQVLPNPANKGGVLVADVLSDGFNAGLTLHAKHLGTGQEATAAGLLGADGKFRHATQINIAGYYEAWVTSGAVTSPKVKFTVQGLHIAVQGTTVHVFSHLIGPCQVWADDPARSLSIPIGTVTVNQGGYGSTQVNLSDPIWVSGTYGVDCVIGGVTAKSTEGMGVLVVP